MDRLVKSLLVGLVVVSLVGCRLAAHPIPEVLFFPISEVVFLPLMIGLSHNPSDSDRAQIETYKKPYTQCLLGKGYKPQ